MFTLYSSIFAMSNIECGLLLYSLNSLETDYLNHSMNSENNQRFQYQMCFEEC
jgi:hypothetical protein